MIGERRPTWSIDRIELVYSNPRHNRWQLFQSRHGSTTQPAHTEQAFYREQIQILLDCIHKMLAKALEKSDLNITLAKHYAKTSGSYIRAVDTANKLASNKDILAIIGDKNFLVTEGLPVSSIDKIHEFLKAITNQAFEDEDVPSLNRDEALDLLSILPILKTWDLWGMLLPEWLREGLNHTWPDKGKEFFNRWKSQTFYSARLTFHNNSSDKKSGILDYRVDTELFTSSSDSPARSEMPEQGDFFDFSFSPTDETEKRLYYTYAFFIDTIQKFIAGDPGTVFIICYPLDVHGRRHFLQVYFRLAGHKTKILSTKHLWQSWMSIHQSIFGPAALQIIRETLSQIDIEAFNLTLSQQLQSIALQKGGKRVVDDEELQSLFCEVAPIALPMESICQRVPAKNMYYEWKYKATATIENLLGDAWQASSLRSRYDHIPALIPTLPDLFFKFPRQETGFIEADQLHPLREIFARQLLSRRWRLTRMLNRLPSGPLYDLLIAGYGIDQEDVEKAAAELSSFRKVADRLDLKWRQEILRRIRDRQFLTKKDIPISDVERDSLDKLLSTNLAQWQTKYMTPQQQNNFALVTIYLELTWRKLMSNYPDSQGGLFKHPHTMFHGMLRKGKTPEQIGTAYKVFFQQIIDMEITPSEDTSRVYKRTTEYVGFTDLRNELESGNNISGTAWDKFKMFRNAKFRSDKICQISLKDFGKWSYRHPTKTEEEENDILLEKLAADYGISPGDILYIDYIAHDNGISRGGGVEYIGWSTSGSSSDPVDGKLVHLLWSFQPSSDNNRSEKMGGKKYEVDEKKLSYAIEESSSNLKELGSEKLSDIAKLICYRYLGRFVMLTGNRMLQVQLENTKLRATWIDCISDRFAYYCCIGTARHSCMSKADHHE